MNAIITHKTSPWSQEDDKDYVTKWIPLISEEGDPYVYTLVEYAIDGDHISVINFDPDIQQFDYWNDDIIDCFEIGIDVDILKELSVKTTHNL